MARHIVTISEFSRQEIIRFLGVDPSRVSSSALAIDPVFERPVSVEDSEKVLAKYALTGKQYIFLPAQLWPHKNHQAVLGALRRLSKTRADPPLLVCTGLIATQFGENLVKRTAQSDIGHLVRFLGRCPQHDLPALYAGAQALVLFAL